MPRYYLESTGVATNVIKMVEQVFGSTQERIFLIAILDGAESFHRQWLADDPVRADYKASQKEDAFQQMCRRLIRAYGGELLDTEEFPQPADAILAAFLPFDAQRATCAALQIKRAHLQPQLHNGLWIEVG